MHHYNVLAVTCWVILSSTSSLVSATCESAHEPRVSLSTGCVEGVVRTTVLGRSYYSFQGIPYAAPPVGDLRFKAPSPPLPWSGVLNATADSPACLQPLRETPFPLTLDEDCLYLNVFTPYLKHPNGKRMPVIVWIHGGKFFESSGSTYKYGPDFLLMKDVILVTINYRLGIFGFINLNISEAQGNASLKDVVAALRWVQREIGKFGGDPSRVTVSGGSSGGSEVAFLYVSPLAKGLFHRAISQSGSALCQFAFNPTTTSIALRVAASLGCPTHDPQKAVSCLRGINGSVLAEQQMIVHGAQDVELPFLPSTETDHGEEVFLPDTPQNLISKSGDVPYLIGFNNGEGLMYMDIIKKYATQNITEVIMSLLPDHLVKNVSQSAIQDMVTKINNCYFKRNNSLKDNIYGLVNFMSDKMFSFCILKTVEALSSRAPVYLYYFTLQGAFQPHHTYQDQNITGVCHGDELGYMFYRNSTVKAHNNISLYPRDMEMVEKIINLWTNFATYGNPTPLLQKEINTTWETASSDANSHLVIGDTLQMVHSSVIRERESLWENLYEIADSQHSSVMERGGHIFIYTIMSLFLLFGSIFGFSYYIQHRRQRSLFEQI